MVSLQHPPTLPRHDGPRVAVREVKCNTLLHRLTYGSATGYTVNLYKGCTHGCVYCYAPSLTHDERRWGTYVDAKVNAPEILKRELRGLRKDEVFFSSASDPYQPVEAKYRLTRRCLELLCRRDFPVSILTRSPLVLRDLEVLREFRWLRVGMSITTVPTRRFEPGVPPLARRIDTLKKLAEAGISTWVSLAPVIPGMMMVDLDELFEELSGANVSAVSFCILRFTYYDESRKMFEERTGMSTAEALAGNEEVTARLNDLVRKHGMEWKVDESRWTREASSLASLDSFF